MEVALVDGNFIIGGVVKAVNLGPKCHCEDIFLLEPFIFSRKESSSSLPGVVGVVHMVF